MNDDVLLQTALPHLNNDTDPMVAVAVPNDTDALTDEEPLYSDVQNRILSSIPTITGALSLLGSSLIIYVIWKERRKLLKNSYDRIILGLSLFDFLSSFSFVFFGPWAVPAQIPYVVGARADTFLWCDMSGWMTNMVVGSILYTAALMVHFVLHIKLEWAPARIATRVEPWLHTVSVVVPLVTASYGVSQEFMNPVKFMPGVCWLASYPASCEFRNSEVPCERGDGAISYMRGVSSVAFLTIVIVVVTMILLILKVRSTELRMTRYDSSRIIAGNGSLRQSRIIRRPFVQSQRQSQRPPPPTIRRPFPEMLRNGPPRQSSHEQEVRQSQFRQSGHRPTQQSQLLAHIRSHTLAPLTRTLSSHSQHRASSLAFERTRKTAKRGLAYIAAFALCFVVPTVFLYVLFEQPIRNRPAIFIISFLLVTFVPLQGFFNAFIYLTPKWPDLTQKDRPLYRLAQWFSACRGGSSAATRHARDEQQEQPPRHHHHYQSHRPPNLHSNHNDPHTSTVTTSEIQTAMTESLGTNFLHSSSSGGGTTIGTITTSTTTHSVISTVLIHAGAMVEMTDSDTEQTTSFSNNNNNDHDNLHNDGPLADRSRELLGQLQHNDDDDDDNDGPSIMLDYWSAAPLQQTTSGLPQSLVDQFRSVEDWSSQELSADGSSTMAALSLLLPTNGDFATQRNNVDAQGTNHSEDSISSSFDSSAIHPFLGDVENTNRNHDNTTTPTSTSSSYPAIHPFLGDVEQPQNDTSSRATVSSSDIHPFLGDVEQRYSQTGVRVSDSIADSGDQPPPDSIFNTRRFSQKFWSARTSKNRSALHSITQLSQVATPMDENDFYSHSMVMNDAIAARVDGQNAALGAEDRHDMPLRSSANVDTQQSATLNIIDLQSQQTNNELPQTMEADRPTREDGKQETSEQFMPMESFAISNTNLDEEEIVFSHATDGVWG